MSDDLIKRSDAIVAITNHCENECYYRVDNWCPQCQRKEFEEIINAIPSVDRPQGYWIKIDVATYRCSKCGKIQIADDDNELNFCCCCGSRNKVLRLKGADDE